MTSSWPIASLPGPRRQLHAITADFGDGLSCVWLLPDRLVDGGMAEELMREVTAGWDAVWVARPEVGPTNHIAAPAPQRVLRPPAPAPAWPADRFGLLGRLTAAPRPQVTLVDRATSTLAERMLALVDRSPDADGDPLTRLAASEWLRDKVIVVPAWNEPDPAEIGAVVVRFAAMMKGSGMVPAHRPRLLVVGRERDLPASALERLDSVAARVHWWWGGIGRLDTAVVAAAARPLACGPDPTSGSAGYSTLIRDLVFDEVVVEVAGPDLALAEHLASTWDGQLATLRAAVERFVAVATETAVIVPQHWRAARDRPPGALRRLWALGLADLFDGEIRISPVAGQSGQLDLDRLVWRGQNRALTPVVDRGRAYLEEHFRKRASMAVLTELVTEDDWQRNGRAVSRNVLEEILELNRMAWAVNTRRVRLTGADTELLYCLRDVRNKLAHLIPLTDDQLRRLHRVLPDEM